MSLLSDLLSRNITSVNESQLEGLTAIKSFCFYGCKKLITIELPGTIESIGMLAFNNCSSLKNFIMGKSYIKEGREWTLPENVSTVEMENINPYSFLNRVSFGSTAWYGSFPEDTMICAAKGRILIGNKVSKPSKGFKIPSTVINLAGGSCSNYGSADSNFTSFEIPNTIEIVGSNLFDDSQPLKTIIVPASVKEIRGVLTSGTYTTVLIFRHPADMLIKLPTPGEDTGIAGNKSSRSIDIYTDNKMLKAYDWAKDNVTATIHPLSEAPA